MADKKTDVQVNITPVIDEKQVNQELDKLDKITKKHLKDGYIKLPVEITGFKYPKQKVSKSGWTQGEDYSKLQKAQDELISSWKKLSKQGFSSPDTDIMNVMKAYKAFQEAVSHQYAGTTKDTRDENVMRIRQVIGDSLKKYFTRLAPATLDNGKKGSLMSVKRTSEFETYANQAILRHKAAKNLGIDLSQSELAIKDILKIQNEANQMEKQMEKEKLIEKSLAQRQYDKDHAKEVEEENKKKLAQIRKEAQIQHENAIPIPKGKIPEIALTTTEVQDLSAPTDYEQTKEDKAEDKRFLKGIQRGAPARKFNTPNNQISLATRAQAWDPTYLSKKFLQKMERGGTYVDTNTLLRQTMAAIPEELKRTLASTVIRINKDEATQKFARFNDSDKKQWSDIANQTGMSKLLLANVAKIQAALMRGDKETESEDLKKAIAVAVADAVKYGKSQIAAENYNKAVISIGNMLMSRYDNMKDAIGGTDGDKERGVGVNYEEVAETLKGVFKEFEKTGDELLRRATKEFPEFYNKETKTSKNKKDNNTFKQTFDAKLNELQALVSKEVKTTTKATETQGRFDRMEYAAERVADNKEGNSNEQLRGIEENETKILESDASTGMNADKNVSMLFAELKTVQTFMSEMIGALGILASAFDGNIGKGGGGRKPPTSNGSVGLPEKGGPGSYQSILTQITQSLNNIDVNVGNILQSIVRESGYIPTNLPAIVEGEGVKSYDEPFVDKTKTEILNRKQQALESRLQLERFDAERAAVLEQKKEEERLRQQNKEALKKKIEQIRSGEIPSAVDTSTINTDTIPSIFDKIKKVLNISSPKDETEVDKVMSMNERQQALLLAKRRKIFGFADTTRDATNIGDVTRISRAGQIWRRNKPEKSDTNPFRNLKITEGINVDYDAINRAMQTAIERNQFSAQTGGGFFKQLWGSMTMYAGQESIEKSRAKADALNTVMAMMKDSIQDLVNQIKIEEQALKGMEDSGDAIFNDKGVLMDESSNEAFITAAKMEELKMGLQGVLAEATMADDIATSVNYNVDEILKRLGFAAPELQKCNKLIKNINIGLDKNGKAYKFQTRTQEILNYSYQLMGRHIGQIFKNWMMMLNPINAVKKAFGDFASYDTKWQRTMNVIKYNIRRIIMPAMQWIAQQIVNIIGLANALIKGIGSAFGQNWDLFDKSAASAEKTREEMEAAANVSAGFDELHDIGSDGGSVAEDLSGDIYTPQWTNLNEVIEGVGEKIGNVFKTIQGLTENWDFWDWLILAGAALAGYKVLKWLIDIFSGKKNPLQTVANGFSFLEKSVGWAILIASFTEFTKALTEFVDCVSNTEWDDIKNAMLLLAEAFILLTTAMILISKFVTFGGWTQIAGIAIIAGVFDLIVLSLIPFINALKEVTSEQLLSGLALLAGTLATVGVVVGVLAAVFTAIATTGVGLAALGILAGILAVVALVILAMAEFVKALKDAGDDVKLVLEGIAEIIRTVGDVIVGVISTIANFIVELISTIGETITNIITAITDGISNIVTSVAEGISTVITTVADAIIGIINSIADAFSQVGDTICQIVETIANAISTTVEAIANGIVTVLQPIMDFVDSIMGKIIELATTIAHEVGETIRTVIETTGNVVVSIIEAIVGAIPTLLDSILNFCREIGPAIENSADAIIRTITKLINFTISGIEYVVNTLVIGSINKAIETVTLGLVKDVFTGVSIPRFVPQYETGTNYVPNDGLAYLHKGEAVIPKKYNQPYQQGALSLEEQAYMRQMMSTMKSLDSTMKQGITVNGQFVQRGSDLVAVVNKTKSQMGADLLSNVAYAR